MNTYIYCYMQKGWGPPVNPPGKGHNLQNAIAIAYCALTTETFRNGQHRLALTVCSPSLACNNIYMYLYLQLTPIFTPCEIQKL